MSERDELFDWLRKNRVHFRMSWDPHDVAYFAIHMNGFTPALVYDVLSHFDHALCNMSFDKSLRQMGVRFQDAVQIVRGELSLRDQWDAVSAYQGRGAEFEEGA